MVAASGRRSREARIFGHHTGTAAAPSGRQVRTEVAGRRVMTVLEFITVWLAFNALALELLLRRGERS